MQMLSVNGLEKSFGSLQAVKGITFSVRQGESFGLLGPNGAGKSTAIGMISGLFAPSKGEIRIKGIDMVAQPKKAQRLIGVVPQDIALYQDMTARENLLFWGSMYGLRGPELKRRIAEVLEIVGLAERAKDKVGQFSGGMKRRVNIGAAILHRPELLIMDEPTVGIDPQSRNHILETVKRLNQAGMTIIYTSHYMEEVEFLCERIGIIDHGEFIASGTVSELRETIGNRSRIVLTLAPEIGEIEQLPALLQKEIRVEDFRIDGGQLIAFHKEPQSVLSGVIQSATSAGLQISSVNIIEPNLESVFLHLTGRSLRD